MKRSGIGRPGAAGGRAPANSLRHANDSGSRGGHSGAEPPQTAVEGTKVVRSLDPEPTGSKQTPRRSSAETPGRADKDKGSSAETPERADKGKGSSAETPGWAVKGKGSSAETPERTEKDEGSSAERPGRTDKDEGASAERPERECPKAGPGMRAHSPGLRVRTSSAQAGQDERRTSRVSPSSAIAIRKSPQSVRSRAKGPVSSSSSVLKYGQLTSDTEVSGAAT